MSRRKQRLVRAELKRWDCPDLEPDAELTTPGIAYDLACHIGMPGDAAADIFYIAVMDVRGMKDNPHFRGRSSGPTPVVVEPYDWTSVRAEVERRIAMCEGYDWLHICDQLRSHFRWEYEGMGERR